MTLFVICAGLVLFVVLVWVGCTRLAWSTLNEPIILQKRRSWR